MAASQAQTPVVAVASHGGMIAQPGRSSSGISAQKAEGKNGAWLTAGIIVADVVGAGILGMPKAMSHFGWLLGSAVMALMLAANVHISLLLWRVRMGCKTGGAPCRTYVDLCQAAFAAAPAWQRRLMVSVTGASQYCFIFSILGLYLLSAGTGMGMAGYMERLCLPKWTAIACCCLLPFACSLREMGSCQSLVVLNIVTLTCAVAIPLVYYGSVGVEGIRPEGSEVYAVSPLTRTGVLSGVSTLAAGMTSQFMVNEIMSEMKDIREMPKAYAMISAPFQFTAFMAAGLGGYFFLGDKATGMITENLPFGPAFQVAGACVVTHMLVSYLLKGIVFCRAVLEKVKQDWSDPNDNRKRAWAAWDATVIVTLAAAYLLANLVPFFGDAVNLLGASFTPLSCWLIPICMFARHYVDAEEKPVVSRLEWLCLFLEFVGGLGLMILGTQSALMTITENWHTYGYPFECHCKGIWETCACSAQHIGMEELCLAGPGQ